MLRRSPRLVSAGTATMSARGTITSSTRMRWNPSTFLSIARSWGEKFGSCTVSARASSRSSRIESRDFRPNLVRRRSYQRSRAPSGSGFGRAERSSRLRSSFIAGGFSRSSGETSGCHITIGVGDAKGGQRLHFQSFHDLRLRLKLVIVAEKVEDAMHDKVGGVVLEGFSLLLGL